MTTMRLQRALARAGVASRRGAEDLIIAGRVRVNGAVAMLGMSVDPDTDEIEVGGVRVRQSPVIWLALNKPTGYLVTKMDPKGRPTVFDLLPESAGLTYVGRLDVNTSGLLLLTNDGNGANRLMHPRYGVERTYKVIVSGHSRTEIMKLFSKPVRIEGRPLGLCRFSTRARRGSLTELTMVLNEGRNRIVRRACRALGLKVESLVRVSHGPIRLGRLLTGEWRHLTSIEIRRITRSFGSQN